MTIDSDLPDDPELDQYIARWPGNAHTEAVASAPPAERTIIEEAPVAKSETETPKDFLHTLSAQWAEEKVLELFTAAKAAPPANIPNIFALAQVYATLSVARSIREQTESQAQPPKAWRMNTESGKMEEL